MVAYFSEQIPQRGPGRGARGREGKTVKAKEIGQMSQGWNGPVGEEMDINGLSRAASPR